VPFRASWQSDRVLAIEVDRLLDPAVAHHLTLEVESVSGKSLPTKSFVVKSTTGAVVAGKALSYVPVPGDPRPVVVTGDGASMARLPTLAVLYDQPIHLDVARGLVTLTDREGKAIPIGLRHAPTDAFGSARVDRRHVVWITPRQRLEPGAA